MSPLRVSDIESSYLQKRLVASTASFLKAVSKNDLPDLFEHLAKLEPDVFGREALYGHLDSSDKSILSSLSVCIAHIEGNLDKENEEPDSVQSKRKAHSQIDRLRLRALRAPFVISDISRRELSTHFPNAISIRTLNRMKSEYSNDGLCGLLSVKTVGRLSALKTHPSVISEWNSHLAKDENSTTQNTRTFKTVKEAREMFLPVTHSLVSSNLLIKTVKGGRASSSEGLSASTLRKHTDSCFKPGRNHRMFCSDCKQRTVSITLLNQFLGANFFSLYDTRKLDDIIGNLEVFKKSCTDIDLSRNNTKDALRHYKLLTGTQIHYQRFRSQKRIRASHRENLADGECVIVLDFGENFRMGMKRNTTETTERNTCLLTNFAFALEFCVDGKEREIHHVLVLSTDLHHTAFVAIQMLKVALLSDRVQTILKKCHTFHFWSDNGKHLNCKENSTFILVDVPQIFPNVLLITENRHAAKHGKDLADRTVKIGKEAAAVLMKTEEGFTDPVRDMSRIIDVIKSQADYQEMLSLKSTSVAILFSEALRPPKHFQVLSLTTMDVSSCRKVVRDAPGGETRISEHLRYDVTNGIEISKKLVKVTRVVPPSNVTNIVPADDIGVCSVRTQLQRDERRTALLAEMKSNNSVDVAFANTQCIPDDFDYRKISVGESVKLEQVSNKPTKKRGRPKAQRDESGNVIVRNNTFEQAKRTVLDLHDKLSCDGVFPTRRQFSENGELFLFSEINEGKRFRCTLDAFVEMCGLARNRSTKRRRASRTPL